jgi:A/G-specific adenine glycosylase
VVAEHGDSFPSTVDDLRRLPGVGPYTARAVASIAFGQPVAAVDTNVRRVLGRIFVGAAAVPRPAQAQALADRTLDTARPGDWNQAVMELGARVCAAAAPRCGECPLRRLCAAEPAIRAVRESGARYRAPRSTAAQGRYAGSNRFWRGRVLDVLRSGTDGQALDLPVLGRCLRLDFTLADLPWLRELLAGLARDGLVDWPGDDAPVRLPGE